MIHRSDWFARALLVALCLALPASAATPPTLRDLDDNGLEATPLDVTRHAMPPPEEMPRRAAAVTATPAAPTGANPLWALPLSSLNATRDRPLFSPTRRPPPPAVASAPIVPVRAAPPPPPPPPEHPNLTLLGTVANESEGVAVFVDQATRATVRLHTGEGHMGWVLQSVERSAVTLQKGAQSETLELPRPSAMQGQAPVISPLPPAQLPPPPRPTGQVGAGQAAGAGARPAPQPPLSPGGCMPEPIGC